MEDIVNSMNTTKELKEQIYKRFAKLDGTVLWKDDKIVGMRLNQSLEYVTIDVDVEKKN